MELRKVRGISREIVQQRAEVEQFFLEALEQIKEEIRKKMQEERRLNRYNPHAAAAGEQRSAIQNDSKSYADKVDLNDLDWEDRERVLRLLFSKINAGVHPSQ